jgi:hypothetical protein
MKSFIVLAAQNTCSNIKVIAIFYKHQSHANRFQHKQIHALEENICAVVSLQFLTQTSHTIRIDSAIIASRLTVEH